MFEARILAALREPAFYADPYALYAELRARDPVLFTEMRGGSWFFTGHADVAAGLKLPDMRLTGAPIEYIPNMKLRGLTALPITF